MKTEKNELKRVTMNISERTEKNVEYLVNLLGETNKTRVVASSIEIAKYILEAYNTGDHIIIRGKDGGEQELKFVV